MPPLTIKIQALKVSEMYVRLYGIAQYRTQNLARQSKWKRPHKFIIGINYS